MKDKKKKNSRPTAVPHHDLHTLFREGTHLLMQGKTTAAIPLLESAYRHDPSHIDVALNLSGAYILTKKFRQAVTILEPLSQKVPDHDKIWANLGAAYLGNPVLAHDREQRQAIAAFEQALQINPVAPHVAYNIGLIYRDRQEPTQAIAWFRKALQTDPTDKDAASLLNRLTAQLTAPTYSEKFTPFAERMRAEKLPELVIQNFAGYYQQLLEGKTGLIAESEIRPVQDLPNVETLPDYLVAVGEAVLAQTAVIKLNGGLGTSMGLEQAKSLLVVKNGQNFLDIIAQQVIHAGHPLILMDSFATHEDSLKVLQKYAQLPRHVPQSFLQHKQPKIIQADFSPAVWPADPALEWCPPGHGDLYIALVTSGTLPALLAAGYRYAFVSNADNLGAVVDATILGYMAENQIPFLMEVADRTPMDKKGGHLAKRANDGQLILRESAQCSADDTSHCQDIGRHKYFNTNNLWLDLQALQTLLTKQQNQLNLPLIRNSKTVDPRNPQSTAVYQLETAMGSAIAVFQGARAVRVPRNRFAPVKTCNDLLAVRSDAYRLTDDFQIVPATDALPLVELDPRYYRFVTDLDARFPHGAPSLIDCQRLQITGDVRFGRHVVCRGQVSLQHEGSEPLWIADETILG